MALADEDIELAGGETRDEATAFQPEDDDPESLAGDEVDDDLEAGGTL
ncbi:MAG TPA: hypothetical protein VGJ53_03410 [Micromonosporaceae bacterium]